MRYTTFAPVPSTHATSCPPYTSRQVGEIVRRIGQLRPAHRADAAWLMLLTAGAGLRALEVATLTAADLCEGPALTACPSELSGEHYRDVVVSAQLHEALAEYLPPLPAQGFVFRPERTTTSARVVQGFLTNAYTGICAPPNPRRLRSAWIVAALSATTSEVVADAAGVADVTYYLPWAGEPPAIRRSLALVAPGRATHHNA